MADRTRLLKLGVTSGSDFIYRAYFVSPSVVTVGRGERAVLRLTGEGIPRHLELFSISDESCLLQFSRDLDLTFFHDGLFRRPTYLIDEGLAFRSGRAYIVHMESRARGTLNLGSYRLLFKLEVVERPVFRRIPLPYTAAAPVRCGACRQPMELVLASPGVVTRCGFCNTLNRFVGATGESETLSVPAEQDGSSDFTAEPRDPIVLHEPSGERPAPPPAVLGDRETVVGVGSLHGEEDELDEGAPTVPASPPLREPSASAVTPLHPASLSPDDAAAPRTDGAAPPPGSATDGIQSTAEFFGMAEEPEMEREVLRRAASGDRLRVVHDDDDLPPATSWGALPARREPATQGGGKVVPLRTSRTAAHSLPAPARPQPEPEERAPAEAARTESPGETHPVPDDYAAAKLADRLTMLIFTLIIIALLLAAILGVLVMQGAMSGLLGTGAADDAGEAHGLWTPPASPTRNA